MFYPFLGEYNCPDSSTHSAITNIDLESYVAFQVVKKSPPALVWKWKGKNLITPI